MQRATLLGLLLLACLAPAAEAISIAPGEQRFWMGGQIESGDLQDASQCDIVAPCPTFPLEVAPGGHRLRVAIDTPSREDSFGLDVIAPDGTVHSTDASNVFNAEGFVDQPAAGKWTVRVVPKGATYALVRLRAKLEEAPVKDTSAKHALLPNLRAVPPYELGFVAPANPANAAYPPDTVNPPLSAAGVSPVSCTADETAPPEVGGGGAHDCLRLTSGPINVGEGPFMKVFTFASDTAAGETIPDGPFIRGKAKQRILMSDGTTELRPAGTYSFHTTHAHFHDDGVLTYELFRVDGDQLTPAGTGTKSGFCPADQLMGDWRSFTQDKPGAFGEGDTATGSCYGAADDGLLALTRGWGDVYRWQRPGQYVEFAGNGDGLYVVRTTVDKGNTTLETDETDNSAYALAMITGRRIEVLERGWGTSHLDPAKTVFTGYGPASKDPLGGELPLATAPAPAPDTTLPKLTRVRFKGRRLRFRLSEPARVRITILRRGKRVGHRTVSRPAGRASVRLRALRRGRYRLALAAVDRAGNAATPVRKRVKMR